MSIQSDLDRVLDIAMSGTNDLNALAKMTGLDPFSFYEHADLSGLDLSNQDLTYLSFNGADLTHSNLDNIKYKPGAFNGAKLDARYRELQDRFEFTLEECTSGFIQRIHMFAEIRPGTIEAIAESLGVTYRTLASMTLLHTKTIRNARSGNLISMDTIVKLYDGIKEVIGNIKPELIHQKFQSFFFPIISFTYIPPDGSQQRLSKSDILLIIRMMQSIDGLSGRYTNAGPLKWRDSPGMISWMMTNSDLLQNGDRDILQLAFDLRGLVHLSDDEMRNIMDSFNQDKLVHISR